MATIGEDLRAILNIMPIRDRAGIQRGTMADPVEASYDNPNAEGAALMRPGLAPPPVALPDGMGDEANMPIARGQPASAASGTGFVIPPGSRGGQGAALPPAPRERVVAASPAAAPSPAVMRGSDLIMQALEQKKREAAMNDMFTSIALLGNAFNRSGNAAETRQQLAGQLGGGGGGSPSIAELKMLLDMRGEETKAAKTAVETENVVDHLMRTRGFDRDRARAIVAGGQAGTYLSADEQRKYAGDIDDEKLKTKLRASAPQIAKETGQSETAVLAAIDKDPKSILEQWSPKTRAEVSDKLSTTEERDLKTLVSKEHMKNWAEMRRDPTGFAKRFNLREDQVASMLDDFDAFREGMKTMTPTHSELGQRTKLVNDQRKAAGLAPLSPEQVIALGKETPAPEAAAESEGYKHVSKQLSEGGEKAYAHAAAITNTIDQSMRAWSPKLIAGSELAPLQSRVRKAYSQLTGTPDPGAEKTDIFLAQQAGLTVESVRNLPGALSEKELQFLKDWKGGQQNSPAVLYKLLLIQDKVARARIIDYNERLAAAKSTEKGARAYAAYEPVKVPPPSHFVKQAMATPKGQAQLAALRENKDDPGAIEAFNDQWGKGVAQQLLNGE